MGFIHRYFVQAPVGIALPEPPPELRTARLHGPLGEGWLCLDSARVHDLDLDFARRLSAVEGVTSVLAFLKQTTASVARFENGAQVELDVPLTERLGFDPSGSLGPEVGIYPDRIRAFWLVAFGLAVTAPLLPRWAGWNATPWISVGFLLGWLGGSLWLRHQRRAVTVTGGLLVAVGLALIASWTALPFD
jgi:hypothetical protein